MTFFSYLANAYRSTSYQNKLLISYFIFIMIPLLILAGFSYHQSSAVITCQAKTISSMYVQQAKINLNTQFSQMMNLSQQLAQQNRVRQILEQAPDSLSVSKQYDDLNELDEIVSRIAFTSNIKGIRLYVPNQFLFSKRNLLTYDLDQLDGATWFDQESLILSGSDLTPVYTFTYLMSRPTEIISAVSLIRSSRDFNQIIGVVSVDCSLDVLLQILKTVDFSEKGRAYLIDSKNKVICGYQNETGAVLDQFYPGDDHYLAGNGISVDPDSMLSNISDPVWGGWRILVISPVKPLLADASRLRLQLTGFAVCVGILVYFLAWLYARSNTSRIMNLVHKMRAVQEGHFDVNCIVDSADEIGELQSNFNLMIQKIRSLLDEQYRLGQSLKDSELKILQAQINPHFLYNTLDLIYWTAKNKEMETVCDIVLKLSRFYRLGLSQGQEFITLDDELEQVRLYVDLQNLRFKGKINLQQDVDPDARSLYILKLMLQPIIENSILHGIQNLYDREGLIIISIRIEEPKVIIKVQDNGIGIRKDELSRIQLGEPAHVRSPGTGKFGLHNIMKRLRLYYGEEATLTVMSKPAYGTTVTITLPYEKMKPETVRKNLPQTI